MKALVAAIGALVVAGGAHAGTVDVSITSIGFSPHTVTITTADLVRWTNNTNQAHVVASEGLFESPSIPPGGTYSRSFPIGSWEYYDVGNPRAWAGRINVSAVNPPPPPPPPPSPSATGLRVVGNRLHDGSRLVHLHGVNYSGTEYACIQGWGIFDGPNDQAMIDALKSWRINVVKVPLNETCWLGINGVNPAYSGAIYRTAVIDFVNLLIHNGLYVEVLMMWAAPNGYHATYQAAAPNADHSPTMWASMAQTFRDHTNVILAPYGEPVVNWACLMHTPCNDQATYGPNDQGYMTATMTQAVQIMRANGFNGPIAVPCMAWANLCGRQWDASSTWLLSRPADPLNPDQILAEAHVYKGNVCSSVACFDGPDGYKPILDAGIPVIFGETGDDWQTSGTSYISTFLNWADAYGVSYITWTWNTWGTALSLISSFDGTPNGVYGDYVRTHYLLLP